MTELEAPVLRDIESKLAGLVEGTFGRLFRSEVTPYEVTHGLVREMDGSRRQGMDRTWVADRYEVYVSGTDERRLADHGPGLTQELSNALLRHAREQRYALASTPEVVVLRGEELQRGRYGVRALHRASGDPERMGQPVQAPRREAPARQPAPDPVPEPRPRERRRGAAAIALVFEGRREPVPAAGATIGRSRECDVVIASAEVSRRHCRIVPDGDGWAVEDLGSTNGVRVDGGRTLHGGAGSARVQPGSLLELGTIAVRVEDA